MVAARTFNVFNEERFRDAEAERQRFVGDHADERAADEVVEQLRRPRGSHVRVAPPPAPSLSALSSGARLRAAPSRYTDSLAPTIAPTRPAPARAPGLRASAAPFGDITNVVGSRAGAKETSKPPSWIAGTGPGSRESQGHILRERAALSSTSVASASHRPSAQPEASFAPPSRPPARAPAQPGHAISGATSAAPPARPPPSLPCTASTALSTTPALTPRLSAGPSAVTEASDGNAAQGGDPQAVEEYREEIWDDMFRVETMYMVRFDYMDGQSDISAKMRAILVDWLVEVHMKYRLREETLFLTVNVIDRYLAQVPVARRRLQLVGVVAMFVASKFEEIHHPEVGDFVYITDNAYTKDEILSMECSILTALGFDIARGTAAHFLDRLQVLDGRGAGPAHFLDLCRYCAELSLLEPRLLRYVPSHLAAAATLLGNELARRTPAWPEPLARAARHREEALRPCCEELRSLVLAAPTSPLQAVFKKYSSPQHHSVAARITSGI